MEKFVGRLPNEIILRIISYTYSLQDKTLLNDIVNYTESKTKMFNLYHQRWIIEMSEQEPEDKNWLINDIIAYANNYQATMYGYVDKFYNIFKRNIFLQTNEQIRKYVFKLQGSHVNKEINIYLGLLTPNERNDVILNSLL